MTLQYDPDFFKVAKDSLARVAAAPPSAVHDIEARRRAIDASFGALAAATPLLPDVERTEFRTNSYDDTEIFIYRFGKKGAQSGFAPAIVHFHGGGLIAASVETMRPSTQTHVSKSGVQVFSVEYRLAPEHPFPAPVEDCYAGLKWVNEHAFELGVDPSRIAVFGQSAGGNLAAAVAIMARDRQLSPPLAKQILVYPMLDSRNIKPVAPEFDKLLFWTLNSNITGWTAYLGDKLGSDDISPYASPAFATSFEGLPPAFIDVGGLDLFRDESIAYASRLVQANISVEFHLYPGLPHAFELLGPGSAPQVRALENRVHALKSF